MEKKMNLKSSLIWRMAVVTAMAVMSVGMASAQSGDWDQSSACPGWNNPMNFGAMNNQVTGGYVWQGRQGFKNGNVIPNAVSAQTDITFSYNNVEKPIITGTNLSTETTQTGGDCAVFPTGHATNKAFAIYTTTTQATGHPANKDPNTLDHLSYVPTHFNTFDSNTVNTSLTRSIRIGDACGRPSSSGNYPNAQALYYNMYVQPSNAMMFIYYACVVEQPTHSAAQNPAFIIRVMKQNAAGQWVQASPTNPTSQTNNDTLTYMVTSTPATTTGGTVVIENDFNTNGWHLVNVSPNGNIYYKDWVKVSLNLSNLLYSNVRIEVMVSDCSQMQHFAYAYLCGECRPMVIDNSGCPAGMSQDVTTLTAPRGLLNYVWYASEYGYTSTNSMNLPNSNPNSTAYFTFRQLTSDVGTEADSAYIYHVQADDFRVTYRPNMAHQQNIPASPDSMGNMQTFRCTMTSALDPSKPFTSNLYTTVTNIKPTMEIDSLSMCGGDVVLHNGSYVPGDPDGVNMSATEWMFYNNPMCLGQSDTTIVGDSTRMHFDGGSLRGVRVRSYAADDPTCYSEEIYPIRPLPYPEGGITISQRVLCDDDPATLVDTTHNSTYRVWRFRDTTASSDMSLVDTLVGVGDENRQVTRSFTHGLEPVELMVRNGLYYLNPYNTSDTIWCENVLHDTISVFLHPELQVIGDTIVCQGTLTDATVNAVGVDGCTYQWSTSPNTIMGNIPAGPHLAVTPYADTATYYVRVTSPQNCVAWDSIHAYLVSPKLTMLPADGKVCPGDVVTLTGSSATSYTWSSSPVDTSLAGQDTLQVVRVRPQVNTTYTLVGHGGSGDNICDATPITTQVTVYPYPVPSVNINPGIVDSESPTVTLRDESLYGVSSSWTFDAGEVVEGREVTHTFEEATNVDSVYVILTSANELGCRIGYPFSIPVSMYTSWFPNIFTPGSEDENETFKLYSINTYEHFHIVIYNRRGEVVFESQDSHFEWDGTYKGNPCPQGAYVYVCRFRKPGTYNLGTLRGSVTLVR